MKEIILRTFPHRGEAEELIALLAKQAISAHLGDSRAQMDETILGSSMEHTFEVRIAETDREAAQQILEARAGDLLTDVEPGYYLYDFTDDELTDVLVSAYEWSEFDVALSRKVLTSRGVAINEQEIAERRKKRLDKLAQPDARHFWMVLLGYVFAFGFFGLLVGYALRNSQKVLPDGTKVYVYNEKARLHGTIILIISVAATSLWLLAYLYNPLAQ